MAVTEGGRALILGALGVAVVAHHVGIVALWAAAVAVGGLQTVFVGTTQAAIPELVGDGALDRANGLVSTVESAGAFFVGPAIAGLLFAAAHGLP